MRDIVFESEDKFAHGMMEIITRYHAGDKLGLLVVYGLTIEDAEEIFDCLVLVAKYIDPLEARALASIAGCSLKYFLCDTERIIVRRQREEENNESISN